MSAKLSWSHFIILIGISDETARKFYENQAINENWSIRELERQIDSSLFERLALSLDRNGVLKRSKKGQKSTYPDDVIKDPYVLDFLKISKNGKVTEKDLEQKS